MRSILDDLSLNRVLRDGIGGRLDSLKAQSDAQAARDLLAGERELLRRVRAVLEEKDGDPQVRAALEWCAERRRAERAGAEAQRRADAIYNAYYTHDGIQNGLIALEDYAGDEAGDIEDPETLYMKVYTDRLRILRFLYDKLANADQAPVQDPGPEPVTEALLEPLGWVPVEEDIRRAIHALQAWLDDRNRTADQRSASLNRLSNGWEEHRETLRQNLKCLQKPLPAPGTDAAPGAQEEKLMAAMTRVLAGEAFDALARKPDDAGKYLEKLDEFVEFAGRELLQPFRRD